MDPRMQMETEDSELAYALQISQEMYDGAHNFDRDDEMGLRKSKKPKTTDSSEDIERRSIVDPNLEHTDPTPDIHSLFVTFDKKFFWNKLQSIEVKWSKRMTSCAGVCSYSGRDGFCSIRLSEPLLKLRPRKDLVETLLHEMIHAYLFVTKRDRDRDGHGPDFREHMNRINRQAGTNITIYHTFHDEVRSYQNHWWKCNGPCQYRAPYFGVVKRSMNRPPGPYDIWWPEHESTCGGKYSKIKEPSDYKRNKNNKSKKKKTGDLVQSDIRNLLSPGSSQDPRTAREAPIDPVHRDFTADPTNINPWLRVLDPTFRVNFTGPVEVQDPFSTGWGSLDDDDEGGPSGTRRKKLDKKTTGTWGVFTLDDEEKEKKDEDEKEKEKEKEKEDTAENRLRIDTFKVFSGSGQTLGGGGNDRGKSRLLQYAEPVVTKKVEEPKTSPKEEEPTKGKTMNVASCSRLLRNFPSTSKDGSNQAGPSTAGASSSKISAWNQEFGAASTSANNANNVGTSSNGRSVGTSGHILGRRHFNEDVSSIVAGVKNILNDDPTNKDKNKCGGETDDTESSSEDEPLAENVACPVCANQVKRSELKIHLEGCSGLSNIFANSNNDATLESDGDEPMPQAVRNVGNADFDTVVECPSCGGSFGMRAMNSHLDGCLTMNSFAGE